MGCPLSCFLCRPKAALHEVKEDVRRVVDDEMHSHTHLGHRCHTLHQTMHNRYSSFATPRSLNSAKWFVDGCGYFWALSVALEEARHDIWILDWWLSPELYLRRPPSANKEYRLDRMLKAAADRGVKINIAIYKEVESVLPLSSMHTKHALEALSENISVFRHPDHNPSGREILAEFKDIISGSHDPSDLPKEGLEAIYGLSEDIILFWAHHEKLCIVDGKTAFMGGLDACFGRWDTYQHPIADAHPNDLEETLFPGQDYNNARIYDFQDIENWKKNKLDRTKGPRMGWSDLSVCLEGPIVEDLRAHFVQRWNYIYREKYSADKERNYEPLTMGPTTGTSYHADGSNVHLGAHKERITDHTSKSLDPSTPARNPQDEGQSHHHFQSTPSGLADSTEAHLHHGMKNSMTQDRSAGEAAGNITAQLVRSSARWSHGIPTEHSIADAYIEVIQNSRHFIYIENQFFITATSEKQYPVKNKIGAAIVNRILKAASAGEKYKVIVAMPSVPGFAGDLHAKSSVSALAVMNLQYKSICRGGYSIMEAIEKAGVDPKKFIQFYNLRSYDRINKSETMSKIEKASGVSYETARKEYDDLVCAGYQGGGGERGIQATSHYDHYQQIASTKKPDPGAEYDTVSPCHMLDAPSLTSIGWTGSPESELDGYVSEELYIHTKCLIADDCIAIVGSANLNDRSQLGYHDSEIAVVIEDPTPVASKMDGKPFQASQFAASLRRQIFRKHLGLLPPQDCTSPDANFTPPGKDPNVYDWGSAPDLAVQDPLSPAFEELWASSARRNTDIFERVFRPVPTNKVRTWEQYEAYYGQHFVGLKDHEGKIVQPPKYDYGHVFTEAFQGGVREVKELLSQVKGTLVEMPLDFLCDVETLVKEGLDYNAITAEIYT